MNYLCVFNVDNCLKTFVLAALILFSMSSFAEEPLKPVEIGIEENLGKYIPLDTEFVDETGKKASLKDFIGGKPFILSLVYYECPSICTPLLTDLTEILDEIALEPDSDFRVITISFDSEETFGLAKSKKANYFAMMKRKIPQTSWRFLTGEEQNIKKITDTVGFRYKKVEDEWVHAGAILAVSPEGKIARYLFGITFLPFDVKLALVEAAEGKTGPTINKFLLYCYNYDPQGRKYVFNILTVVGTVSLVVGISFLVFLITTTKKYRKMKQQ